MAGKDIKFIPNQATILVVDDEPINIEILCAMLEQKGYKVDCSSSGLEALYLIKERFKLVQQGKASMYKLILLDFSIPDMDGPEIARQARIFFKENSTCVADTLDPVICCCTAYTEATFMK